jgi:hypothetical protein
LTARYRTLFKLFWFRGDAAFAQPDVYDYCEAEHITYFIRLPINDTLKKIMEPEISTRPVGRPPKSGVKVQLFEFPYRAGTWKKRRRVVCKIEWHNDELFPRVGFIVTNSTHPAWKVVTCLQWPGQRGESNQGGQEYAALGQDQLPPV